MERKHAFSGATDKGWNTAAERLRQKSQWKSAQTLRPKTALPNSVWIVPAAKRTSHSESWDYAWSSKESEDHREKTMLLITGATPPTNACIDEHAHGGWQPRQTEPSEVTLSSRTTRGVGPITTQALRGFAI